jgi:hypothetical protein
MAKDSGRPRGGFDVGETGGALSGLLAEEDELDRRALWRLGTWAAVSIGAVIVALITNQSSIGMRHEQTASADLLKQAQQLQLAARESQNETRRLASAVDTLNSDRDRLYSRVGVLEQGLDSVTGAITRQTSAPSSPPAGLSQSGSSQPSAIQANASQGNTSQSNPSQANSSVTPSASAVTSPPASAPAPAASTAASAVAPAVTASVDSPPPAAKPSPTPVVAPVAATVPAVIEKQDKEKQDKQASRPPTPGEPPGLSTVASLSVQPPAPAQQPSGSLMASKSMMGPPDPAAGRLIEPAVPPKVVTSAPMPEVAAVAPREIEHELASATPELTVQRTEFGVDVGGANSIPGLRALWRGLVKSKANAALAKLRPIIVIKENTNGLGMQLRLVAGPITDAAAAAKICASLTVSDRSCSTAVFEGQRLAVDTDEAGKTESSKAEAEPDSKPASAGSRSSGHRHYYSGRHSRAEESPAPKPEQPSTFSSLIFGKRKQD